MTHQAQTHAVERKIKIPSRYEFLIPAGLFVIFLAVTLPGIAWGAPVIWHPDEIVVRSIKALYGEWQFNEINFDYPSLPEYVMYYLGKLVLALGFSDGEVLVSARVLSALLGGFLVIITYSLARKLGAKPLVATLAGFILAVNSELSHNARFAHNDLYISFFAALILLLAVQYKSSARRGWLYAAFLAVGLAASSKYNGITLILVPLMVYLFPVGEKNTQPRPTTLETFFIGGVLTFLGFAIGTPKSLFWMSYYFKRALPAILRIGNYARQPDSLIGLIGQYDSFVSGMGWVFSLFILAGLLWTGYKLFRAYTGRAPELRPQMSLVAILLVGLLALDLPILLSYNYPVRFFLPMLPALSILTAFFIHDLYQRALDRPLIMRSMTIGLAAFLLFSFARCLSVMLLFLNDARIPGTEFIKTLPAGASLEATYYSPTIPAEHFEREHNYPLYFIKFGGEPLPVNKNYEFNTGEAGLDERQTDYLIIDGFTAARFNDPYICESMPVECDFFARLAAGRSHYRLIGEFTYSLPPFLPRVEIAFVNPEIRVYERIE
jgi:4-amino-4-deoxy-L-arabinose transferase-like glycosyltransferase